MRHRAPGQIFATIKWEGLTPSRAVDLFNALEPWRRGLAVIEEDEKTDARYVLQAGPILGTEYQLESNELGVLAGSIETWLLRRTAIATSYVTKPEQYRVKFTATLGDIVRRVTADALAHTYGDPPINLPATVAGTNTLTVKGYELKRVWELIEGLMGRIGGPDVRIEPALRSDNLGIEWNMTVGSESDPLLSQAGNDWAWDIAALKPGAPNVSVSRDGSNMATRVWVVGSGTGSQTMIEGEDATSRLLAGWPLLERVERHNSVTETETLEAYAEAYAALRSRPVATWGIVVRDTADPKLGRYRPGDWVSLRLPRVTANAAPYIALAAGTENLRCRIGEVSGGFGHDISVALVPQLENR